MEYQKFLLVNNWIYSYSIPESTHPWYIYYVMHVLFFLSIIDVTCFCAYCSLRGKQLYQVPPEIVGNIEHVLAVCDLERSNNKVVGAVCKLYLSCLVLIYLITWICLLYFLLVFILDDHLHVGCGRCQCANITMWEWGFKEDLAKSPPGCYLSCIGTFFVLLKTTTLF